MKHLHETSIPFWRALTIMATVAVVVGGLFASVPAALAAPEDESTSEDERLERWYERELEMRDNQASRLEIARNAAERAQERIDMAKEQGKDVAALETALAAFNAGVDEAQQHHDQASALLDAHAGFDADGHVIDQGQAWDTVREAAYNLIDGHFALVKAALEFRIAVQEWRLAQAAG